ncbi:MAG: hypothetical protein HYV93_06090 [Candidatus Rokubacteria bacterium]|nr:hypothetical protein [Candidatus Rokubacteria bacterium]
MLKHARSGALLVAAALLPAVSMAPTPAPADGVKIIEGSGHRPGPPPGWRHEHRRRHTRGIVKDPRHRVIVVPRNYYYAPSYVAPVYPRWVPGYWSYHWVPRFSTSYLYVPGFYTAEGVWVESHYTPQVTQTGQYQPVWVEGYWAP